ncbi:MAG TPA: gluconate 2-dehydrogenase subunit 3 family protein [Steroidobacteraceae bacterium]|nr:gluconate 2-dehydrogenase subunit 3 family protein [Steroidobacteraceae bacterium]
MKRRAFLHGASVLLGSSALGTVLEAFAETPRKATWLSASELATLAALVDTILPATDSPAASAADTHYFIDLAIPACASPAAQQTFRKGLREFGAKNFAKLPPDKQIALLKARAQKDQAPEYDQSFFKILKDYTLSGYFLSEIGATKALAYEQVPGGYWGDLPLAPDQKAWAI